MRLRLRGVAVHVGMMMALVVSAALTAVRSAAAAPMTRSATISPGLGGTPRRRQRLLTPTAASQEGASLMGWSVHGCRWVGWGHTMG